ncbi:MAG: HIT family protein [bacterium]|nr:HIT family protein [bacterium]
MKKDNCVFCKIVSGEFPSSKIYENNEVLVFLDIVPVNLGHALVIPKAHFNNIYETPEDILANMITVAKIISKAVKTQRKADGINLVMNNDSTAGQVIFHSHMHIIPRFKDDGFGPWEGRIKYTAEQMAETAKKIIEAL